MGIFSRILKIGQAHANKVVDGMEDPAIMIDQSIKDQEEAISETKRSVQNVIATEKQTKAMYMRELNAEDEYVKKAELALGQNKEELATKALERSEEHKKNASSLKPTWDAQKTEVEKLKVMIRKMESELAEVIRNKDVIIAQSKASEVKKDVYEAKAKIGKNNTSDLIERMKAKAERSSYEAEAAEEIAETEGDSLDKEFENLETNTSSQSVQDKLAELKAKMNK